MRQAGKWASTVRQDRGCKRKRASHHHDRRTGTDHQGYRHMGRHGGLLQRLVLWPAIRALHCSAVPCGGRVGGAAAQQGMHMPQAAETQAPLALALPAPVCDGALTTAPPSLLVPPLPLAAPAPAALAPGPGPASRASLLGCAGTALGLTRAAGGPWLAVPLGPAAACCWPTMSGWMGSAGMGMARAMWPTMARADDAGPLPPAPAAPAAAAAAGRGMDGT